MQEKKAAMDSLNGFRASISSTIEALSNELRRTWVSAHLYAISKSLIQLSTQEGQVIEQQRQLQQRQQLMEKMSQRVANFFAKEKDHMKSTVDSMEGLCIKLLN